MNEDTLVVRYFEDGNEGRLLRRKKRNKR